MTDRVDQLFDDLQSRGYAKDKTNKQFRDYMLAPGKQGYENRKQFFEDFKSQGMTDLETYEDFAKLLGLHAATPERRTTPSYQPTAEDMAGFQSTINNAGQTMRQSQQAEQRIANKQKRGAGLDLPTGDFGRVNVGESNRLQKQQHLNPETGELEDTYVTETGLEYENKDLADMEQREIDQQNARQRWEHEHPEESLMGQIDSRIASLQQKRDEAYRAAVEKARAANAPQSGIGKAIHDIFTPNREGLGAHDAAMDIARNDKDVMALDVALRDLQEAKTTMERNRQLEKSSDFLGGVGIPFTKDWFNNWKNFGYGVWDALDDVTYNFAGTNDAEKAKTYLRIKDKMDRGEELTDTETNVALAGMSLAQAQQLADLPTGYTAGQTTAEMAPFMVQMAANPASGMGKAFARKAVRQFGRNGIKAVTARVAARLAGNVGEAAVLSNTWQAPKTMSDIAQRHAGEFGYDEDGNLMMGHYEKDEDGNDVFVEGGKSLGQAIWEGEASSIIENFTELGFGGSINGMLSKAAGSKLGKKIGLGYISDLVGKVGSTPFARSMKRFMERTHWDGMIEEPLEEEYGIILNSLLTGDNQFSDLIDSKQQADIFAGTMWFGGMMAAMNTAVYPFAKRQMRKNLSNADVQGQVAFGEEWPTMKDAIDSMDDKQIVDLLYGIKDDNKFDNEQKAAMFGYAARLKQYQGANVADMLMRMEGNLGQNEAALKTAYDEGEEAQTPDEMKVYVDEAAKAGENLKQYGDQFTAMIANGAEDPAKTLEYLMNNRNYFDDEQIAAAADYYQKQARAMGVMNAAMDKVDLEVEKANAEVRANTHQQTGSVVMAKDGNDMDYYIIGGEIAPTGDAAGTMALVGNGGAVVVKDQFGNVSVKSPEELMIYSMQNSDELIQQNETELREQLIQQADEDITFGSPANEVYDMEDTVTLQDGDGGMVEGQVVALPNAVDGVFVIQTNDGKALQMTADEMNRRIVAHNGVEVERAATPAADAAGTVNEPEGDASGTVAEAEQNGNNTPENIPSEGNNGIENIPEQSGIFDNAGGEAGTENGAGANNPPATALSKIPVRTGANGEPLKNKNGRPILDWHKASVEDAAAALVETTGGDMVMARDTASDLVRNEQTRLEKIRKQKPKGDDPIEIAESRVAIKRQEQEQQAIIKQWQDVNQLIQRQMREQQQRVEAEREAAKSAEQKAREAEEARIRKEEQEKRDLERLREQIEKDKERRNKPYQPIVDARQELAGDTESLAILSDTEPRDLEEWVSSLLSPHSMLWQDASDSEIGLQSELGLKRADMQRFMQLLGTKENGAKPFGKAVLDIYEALPEGLKNQVTDEDVRRVVLDMFRSMENSAQMMHLTEHHRIEEARQMAKENERRDREAEMDAWAEAYHLTPEERDTFEEFMQMAPTEVEQDIINQIIADNEQNERSDSMVEQSVGEGAGSSAEGSEGQVQRESETAGNGNYAQGTDQGAEAATGEQAVADYDVAGRTYVDLRANLKYFVEQTGIADDSLIDNISNYEVDQLIMLIEDWEAEVKANGSADELFEPIHQYVEGLTAKYAQAYTEGAIPTPSIDNPRYQSIRQALVDAYRSGDPAAITAAAQAIQQYVDEGLDSDGVYREDIDDYTGNDPEMLTDQYLIHVFQDRYLDDDEDQEYIKTGLKPDMRKPVTPSEQLKPTDLRDSIKPDTAELGAAEAKAKAQRVKSRIGELLKQYNSVEIVYAELDMPDRELLDVCPLYGVSQEDIDNLTPEELHMVANMLRKHIIKTKTFGAFNVTSKKFVIFASLVNENRIDEMFFHENVHAILDQLNGVGKKPVADDFWNNAPDEGGKVSKQYIKDHYQEKDWEEDFFTTWLGKAMVDGTVDEMYEYLTGENVTTLNYILETIDGYERGNQETTPESGNDGGGTPGVERDNDGGGSPSSPEISEPAEGNTGNTQQPEGLEPNDPIGKTSSAAEIAAEEAKVDTNPTEAQKEAGNYQKGHINVDGYEITIENPKGSVRSGVDSKGNRWETTMRNTYGYIRGTEGVDGDHIDVFLSDNPASGNVYIVDQVSPGTGEFDEHKVMYGFASEEEAREAYLSNYSEGWQGLGAITEVSREEFKKWVESSHRKTKPFAEYKSVKKEPAADTTGTVAEPAGEPAGTVAKPVGKPQDTGKKAKPQDTGKRQKEHKRIVSDDQMEELRKKLMEKFNNLNAGIDVERMLLGAMYAVGKIERGVTKFADYAAEMVNEIGDAIRPYLKAFYNAVRDMPEAAEYRDQMDSAEDVEAFDVYNFDKKTTPDVITKAKQVDRNRKAKQQVKKIEKDVKQKIQQGDLFAGDLFGGEVAVTQQQTEQRKPAGEPAGTVAKPADKPQDAGTVAKPKTAWWSDENRPKGLNPKDYKTYMTDEAKQYFASHPMFDGWKRKDLAFVTAAVWDGVVIPYEALKDLPEIVEAEQVVKNATANGVLQISEEERDQYAQRLLDSEHGSAVFENGKIKKVNGVEDFSGPVRQERKALVIIGYPAAGKSSVFANRLSNEHGARIIDSDTVKPWLEGFDGGNGAGYVQNASSEVAERAIDIAVGKGDNIILPRIGGGSVFMLSAALKLAGYDVQLYFNDVATVTSVDRATSRFAESGRYLSLQYLTSKDGVPSKNFSIFAEENIGDYINELSEGKVQELRGRLGRLLESETVDGKRLWQSSTADKGGYRTLDEFLSVLLESGGTGVTSGLNHLESPIFSYAEWKSNDVAFGEKPKEIWNSKSGKPMPGKENQDGKRKQGLPGEPSSGGEGERQESRGADSGRRGVGSEQDRSERPGSGYSVDNVVELPEEGEETRDSSGGPSRRSGGNARVATTALHKNKRNNVGERGHDYAPTSPKARFNANVDAIRLMRQLMENGVENPTQEEKEVLRKYSGWGGLGTYFNDESLAENKLLRDLLDEDEYNAAVMSINSAYFTPAMVIDTMWDVAKAMGFKGGTVLEGSAGIGNIIGQMPKDMSSRSDIEAVEIDKTSGNILKLLYPDAKVHIQGFQDTLIPNGSVDLAITNVPFVTGLHVFDKVDKDLSRRFTNIHDFCIAKNIRKLKPGGIGIFISSSGTLDKSNDLRAWITDEGQSDVVGAFRLNNETFGGTTATSDIIVVRKRPAGNAAGTVAIDVSMASPMRVGTYEDKFHDEHQVTMTVNDYFQQHPEMMAGEMFFGYEKGDTFRPGSYGLYPVAGKDQEKMLEGFVKHMKKVGADIKEKSTEEAAGTVAVPNQLTMVKEGRMLVDDQGRLCVSRMGVAVPLELNNNKVKGYSKEQCFKDYQEVQKCVDDVLQQQLSSPDDEALKPKMEALNKAYDKFVKRYGYLHKNTAIAFLRNDIDFPTFLELEKYSETKDMKGKVTAKAEKSPIFSMRVLGFKTEPQPKTIKDALIASIFRTNGIDLPWITQKLNESGVKPESGDRWTEDDVRKGILVSRLGFENPSTGQLEVRYVYLSGNVREKLAIAEAYNKPAGNAAGTTAGKYQANIEELRKVVPMDIPAHLIDFTLGSSWIPNELYIDYLRDEFGLPQNIKLTHLQGTWVLDVNKWSANNETNKAKGVYSQKFRTNILGSELALAALNNRTMKVSRQETVGYGSSKTTRTVVDQEATAACNVKIDEIKDGFKQYLRKRVQDDQELSRNIETIYNNKFNALVPLHIDDEMLPERFENANMNISLYNHQKRGVLRGVTAPTMLAHEVGTGKSFTLISTAMEMRRLGTAKKPMLVVQNATVAQMTADAKLLYPNAKVLSLSEKDRDAEGRRAFYAKIKFNDWDLIIIPQSTLDMIPDSPERELQFIQEQIDEKKHIIELARAAKMDSREIQKLERELEKKEQEYGDKYLDSDPANGGSGPKRKSGKRDAKREAASLDKAETKAQEKLDRKTDDVQFFDDLGVDAILVDEAHGYKHLGFDTTLGRSVKGVDPSYSKKCAGLYNKTRAVFEKSGWKNVVFATGTPISNTAAEIWTFMKYLMPADVMKQNDIYYFDDFVHNFGSINQMLEFKTNGKFNEVTRFAAYVNRPELMRIWMQVADIVRTDEVPAVKSKVPEKEGGKDQDVFLPQSPSLISIMTAVRAELERFENMDGKEKRENSHIPLTMYGIAKRAAIDSRLVSSNAPDEPTSKTNAAVKEILKDLEATKKYKGTVAVFCDNQNRLGKPAGNAAGTIEFNIFDDMKDKLVRAGVPEAQIAVIKSSMSITAKQKIFDKVNTGDVRVILGSTQTLGTGVNIQERLHLLIHMDAPDRPMDYTQRNGRIERQGNLHREWGLPIRILRFGVEDSLDVTAYQRLKTKSGFIDSIMNGKSALANNQTDRTIEEEEEGLFDNPVAVLSGSQFALKKNQAERELRKMQGKYNAWEADQIYVTSKIRSNDGWINNRKLNIVENERDLANMRELFPDGKVKTITVDGTKVDMGSGDAAAYGQLAKVVKEKINDPVNATVKKLRENQIYNDETQRYTIELDGHPVVFEVNISRASEWDNNAGKMRTVVHKTTSYKSPDLHIEEGTMLPSSKSVMEHLDNILEQYVTGSEYTDAIALDKSAIERTEKENAQLKEREGKPFEFAKELEEAKKRVDEYTELMKQEMKEKEAKYAQQIKDAEKPEGDASGTAAIDLSEAEDNDEDVDLRYSADEDDDPIYSRSFKDYFGDWESDPENASKVVDENGRPLIVYHGTKLNKPNHREPFYTFYPDSHFGTLGQAQDVIGLSKKNLDSNLRSGIIPTMSLTKTYPVYLNIRNPKRVSDVPEDWEDTHSEWWEKQIERAKYQGYDGLVYLNKYEDKEHPADSWVAFYPEQVKSADENIGTYDAKDPDIRHREMEKFEEGQTFAIFSRTEPDSRNVLGAVRLYYTSLMPDEYASEHQLVEAIRNQYPEYFATVEDGEIVMRSYQQVIKTGAAVTQQRTRQKGTESYMSRKTRNAINAVEAMAQRMGLDVEVMTSTEGLTGKKARSKGWFNPKTGKIILVLPNHVNQSDLINTLLHEGVAHFGLRKMFGSNFEIFLDNVYNNAALEIRARIDAAMKRNKWGKHEATEEYLARLAERTDFERASKSGWWQKIKNFFLEMLSKAGFDTTLTDNELRYILWRSYENLIHPGRYRNIFDTAKDIDMQRKLGVSRYAKERDRLQRTGRIDTSKIAAEARIAEMYVEANRLIDNLQKNSPKNIDEELSIKSQVAKLPEDQLQYAYNRVNNMMLDEEGLNFDEHNEKVKQDWIAKHGLEGVGKAMADDMNAYIEKYGWGLMTLRWELMDRLDELGMRYSIRKKEAPKKTGIGYKVFVLKDGQLYPPMVANPGGEGTPVGVWLDADAAPIAGTSKTGRPQVKAGGKGTQGGSGQLAYRPGWHLGTIPYALQFNRKDENGERTLFPNNFVWAEVEYANDVDYQDEANQEGINANGKYQHSLAGLKHIPTDGSYMYRTNPDPRTDPWIITGAMRVKKILNQEEVDELVRKAGREPQKVQPAGEAAETDAKQEAIDELNAEIKATMEADEMGLLYRSDDDDIAKDIYEEAVAKDSFKWKENWQDSMASLQTIQNAIAAETGKVATGAEDAYRFENRMHGRAKNMTERYDWQYYRPMLKAFNDFCKESDLTHEQGMEYLVAKSGLERNMYYAFRDAMKEKLAEDLEKERKKLEKDYAKQLLSTADYLTKKAKLTERERTGVDDAIQQLHETLAWKRAKEDYDKGDINYDEFLRRRNTLIRGVVGGRYDKYDKDYSGLTETFAKELYDDAQEIKKDAQRTVDPKERRMLWSEYDKAMKQAYQIASMLAQDAVFAGEPAAHAPGTVANPAAQELWEKINAATEETLKESYESGLMDKKTYEKVRGMFDYYIPLRGWEEDKAADVYIYMGRDNVFNPAVKKTWGRTSKAENPLAYIGNIAVSTILSGHRNQMKQHFLNYVMNNPTSLVSISESWYENIAPDGEAPVWILRSADTAGKDPDEIAQIVNDFNDEMQQKQREGKAMPVRGRLRLDVHATQGQKAEHVVEVQRAGRTYQLYINGNPKAAQALNGSAARAVSRISDTWLGKKITGLNRSMAAFFTSKNPAFVVSNLSRDLNMAGASVAVNEGKAYNAQFIANVIKVLAPRIGESAKWVPASKQPTGLMPSLMRKWKKGTLNESNETERYFKEFMDEGGETGFVNMLSVESFKEKMQKEIAEMNGSSLFGKNVKETTVGKGLRLMGECFEFYNRCAEDATRFIVYMTSRQMGKTLEESIADAKDVTLNFNRKGTGGMGNAELRDLFIFVNPAIQALANMYKMATGHSLKFGAVTAAFVAGGALMPIINEWMLQMWGDDDDKQAYWNLPPWVRKNNFVFWIPFTKNFLTIPLAQEFRVFYGVGEMMSSAIMDHPVDKWGLEVASSVADLVPINPTGNGGNLMVDFAPTMVQPLMQVGENVDFTGRPIWKENQGNKYAPMYTKAYITTPKWMIKVSEGINDVTGGNEGKKGVVEKYAPIWGDYVNNPAVWNHLLQGYFGGMYNTIAKTFDVGVTAFSGEVPKVYQTPVVNRFLNRPVERDNAGVLGDDYYNLTEERDALMYELRTWKKKVAEAPAGEAAGTVAEAQEHVDEIMDSPEYKRAEVVSHYEKIIKDLKAGEKAATDKDDKANIKKSISLYKEQMMEELNAIDDGKEPLEAALEAYSNAKTLAEKNRLRLRIERLTMRESGEAQRKTAGNGGKNAEVEKALSYIEDTEKENRNTNENYLKLATAEDIRDDARIKAVKAKMKPVVNEYKQMIADGKTAGASKQQKEYYTAWQRITALETAIKSNKKLLGKGNDALILKMINSQRKKLLEVVDGIE